MLGDLIGRLRNPAVAQDALLATANLTLLASVEDMRLKFDESAGEYVAGAVQRFVNRGGHEEWRQLMTHLERGDDSATCFELILKWALAQDRAEFAGECERHPASAHV